MRLALIFEKQRPDTTGVYFERACQGLGLATAHWAFHDRHRIPPEYDFYLRVDHGDDYDATWPAALQPSAFFVSDSHLPYNWRKIVRAAGRYGVMFCAQRTAAAQLPNGVWLPFACDPALSASASITGPWDIAFVGTDGGVPRKFVLQALRERYPRSYIGPAPHTQLQAIYRQARVGFNYSIGAEINMRIFEVLAAGTLLVTNTIAHGDLARLGLEENQHYVAYRRLGDLWSCLDRWMAEEPLRQQVAAAGQAWVLSQHTYQHRMRTLLKVAAERLGIAAG